LIETIFIKGSRQISIVYAVENVDRELVEVIMVLWASAEISSLLACCKALAWLPGPDCPTTLSVKQMLVWSGGPCVLDEYQLSKLEASPPEKRE
jgi:hypothetical protein